MGVEHFLLCGFIAAPDAMGAPLGAVDPVNPSCGPASEARCALSSPRFPTPPDNRRDFGSHHVRRGKHIERRVAQHQPATEYQGVLSTSILAEHLSCTVEFASVHLDDRSAATVDEVADERADCRIHLQIRADPMQCPAEGPLRFRGEPRHCQPDLTGQLSVAASRRRWRGWSSTLDLGKSKALWTGASLRMSAISAPLGGVGRGIPAKVVSSGATRAMLTSWDETAVMSITSRCSSDSIQTPSPNRTSVLYEFLCIAFINWGFVATGE